MNNWRRAVEAELGEPVLDSVWSELDERGDIEDLDLKLATLGQVAAKIKNISAALSAPLGGRTGRPEPDESAPGGLPHAGEATRARIDALSVIYAARAGSSRDVRRFRETALARTRAAMAAGSGTVYPAPADEIMLSEAQVPGWVRWCFSADSADGDGDRHVRELIASTSPRGPRRVADLWYIADKRERAQTVDASGVLGQLAQLAQNLADQYRWRPSQATMLVLTGYQPEVFVYLGSAEIRYGDANATTRVVMTLDPALSEEEVAGIYGRLRQRFHPARPPRYQPTRRYRLAGHIGPHIHIRLGEPGSRAGPGRPPSPGPSGLATFFDLDEGYSWESLRRDWNTTYSGYTDQDTGRSWQYQSPSNFIRDSRTAVAQLLYPGWTNRR